MSQQALGEIVLYRTYQARTLSPVEEAYLESVKALGKKVANKGK